MEWLLIYAVISSIALGIYAVICFRKEPETASIFVQIIVIILSVFLLLLFIKYTAPEPEPDYDFETSYDITFGYGISNYSGDKLIFEGWCYFKNKTFSGYDIWYIEPNTNITGQNIIDACKEIKVD